MRSRPVSLWRHADFLRLWSAESVSLFGTQATFLTVTLIATFVLDATPRQMGILGAMGGMASLFAGLLAGVLADRLRRRPLMVVADVLSALLILAVPTVWALGSLVMFHLYLVEFLVGGLTTVSYVAGQSYLPVVVGRGYLVEANGKLRASEALAQVAGPSFAGGLAQFVAAPLVLVLDSLSFLASAILVGSIRTVEPGRRRQPDDESTGAFGRAARETAEGLRWILGSPLLRAVLATSVSLSLFSGVFAALFVLFAGRGLGLSPAAIGAVLAFQGIGSILGALLSGRISHRLETGPSLVLSAAGMGLGWLVLPLAGIFGSPPAPTLVFGLFLSGFCYVVYVVQAVSLRQRLTPDEILGRVNAGAVALIFAATPVGSLLGGFLAESLGARAALALGAMVGASGFLWTLFSPVRRLRTPPIRSRSSVKER